MTDTAPKVEIAPPSFNGAAQDGKNKAQPQSQLESGRTSQNKDYQMDYDKLMKKGVQPSNVQIYDRKRKSALQTGAARLSTKPTDEKSYMATTKAKFFRQAAIQDDMNYELSRKFIGKSNTTYKKLKNLTDFTEELPPSPGKRSKMSGGPISARHNSKQEKIQEQTPIQKEADQKNKLRTSKSMHQDQLAKMQMKLNDQQKLYLQLQDVSDDQLRRNFEQRMSSSRKRGGSRSKSREGNDILNQKNKSLQKIGVNLKADRARVDEKDEGSDGSDVERNFENSIRREKIDELTRRLHQEGEQKTKVRIEMAENKEKLDMSSCTFKPTVNKLTTKQKYYRENRFVDKTYDEPKVTFEMKQKRAQTADAKKVDVNQKPVVKAQLPQTIHRNSTSKSAEKVPMNREITGIEVKPLDLGRVTEKVAGGDAEPNIPFEMSDDGVAKYQSNIQLRTMPLTSDRHTGNLSERNIGKDSRITNVDGNDMGSSVRDSQVDVFNYLSMKGSLVEKKKVIEQKKQQRDMELCTFVPKINKPRAKTMKRDPSNEKEDKGKAEEKVDRFTQLSKKQRVYEKYQKDREIKELQYCTFQPQLDKKSRKIIEGDYNRFKKGSQVIHQGNPSTGNQVVKVVETKASMFRHDELYNQHKNKQQKIKELQDIKAKNDMLPYTFKPDLSKTNKKQQTEMKGYDMTTESKNQSLDQQSKAISQFYEDDARKNESLRQSHQYQDLDEQIKQRFAPRHHEAVEQALQSARRTKADRVNPLPEHPEIVFKSEPNKKQKALNQNGVKNKPSGLGKDKPMESHQILESASRIIKQHGSDKKSKSPTDKKKKEEKEGVYVPPGLNRYKTLGNLGSPRNSKFKYGLQKSAQNLNMRLEDIKQVRNEVLEKQKITKTPVNKDTKIGFAPYQASKNDDQGEKKDGTIYKNLQKVKGVAPTTYERQQPSEHRNSFSNKQSKLGSIGRAKLGNK